MAACGHGHRHQSYAVRSLAGLIDRMGLLHRRHATERRILRVFRYYEAEQRSEQAENFSRKFCHNDVEIEMLGIWDCVKALGLPYPILSYFAPMATEFHDDALGPHVRNGFHALAIDERTGLVPGHSCGCRRACLFAPASARCFQHSPRLDAAKGRSAWAGTANELGWRVSNQYSSTCDRGL